uniref:Uncharacterized protein n=1 Tax=Anopheles albimanus TaxID=7167 RepID=A0A182FXR9_ANOAL
MIAHHLWNQIPPNYALSRALVNLGAVSCVANRATWTLPEPIINPFSRRWTPAQIIIK